MFLGIFAKYQDYIWGFCVSQVFWRIIKITYLCLVFVVSFRYVYKVCFSGVFEVFWLNIKIMCGVFVVFDRCFRNIKFMHELCFLRYFRYVCKISRLYMGFLCFSGVLTNYQDCICLFGFCGIFEVCLQSMFSRCFWGVLTKYQDYVSCVFEVFLRCFRGMLTKY